MCPALSSASSSPVGPVLGVTTGVLGGPTPDGSVLSAPEWWGEESRGRRAATVMAETAPPRVPHLPGMPRTQGVWVSRFQVHLCTLHPAALEGLSPPTSS